MTVIVTTKVYEGLSDENLEKLQYEAIKAALISSDTFICDKALNMARDIATYRQEQKARR